MAQPFKKQIVRYYGPDGQRCTPDAPGAEKRMSKSRKYYGWVPQPDGKRKAVALCPDLGRSKQLLNKLLTDAVYRQHGLGDPFAEQRNRPLAEHLSDFRRMLTAKGNHHRHVKLTLAHLEAVLGGCNFQVLADLDAAKASEWLASIQANSRPIDLPPAIEAFRLADVAKLLGISPGSVTKAIRRQGLKALGKGPARRYPRETVVTLLERTTRGVGPETINHYIRSLRSFGRWLVRSRRWGSNPFDTLSLCNTATDRRRERRELNVDELRRLLSASRESKVVYRGLNGNDRFCLYATACGTGFRASALANLTPENFDLLCPQPTVTLPAKFAKNRKTKVQPLPPDLADMLHAYLELKPAGQPIWGGTWARHFCAAEMLRVDLAAAGIAYVVNGHDGPLYADFHSLRHSYLTLGGRAGIDLRTLQELAGHSTPTLTARYSHRRLNDLVDAVEKLPSLLPTDTPKSLEGAPPTPNHVDVTADGCTLVAQIRSNQGQPVASTGTEARNGDSEVKQHNPLNCQRVASTAISRHQTGELGFEGSTLTGQRHGKIIATTHFHDT